MKLRSTRNSAIAKLALAAAALLVLPPSAPLLAESAPPDTPALRALLEGRVYEAQSLLHTELSQNPANAAAHLLLCRVFYAQDQADSAIQECEQATAADPHSSDSFLWLGRAYGMKARHAGPLAAFTLARKVHASFEAAAQLNPANIPALSDLGEYYVDAPAIVGGGDDKARALAARMMPQNPSAAHGLLAQLADSNKDLPAAGSEYKLAISTARGAENQANAWIDLARFYQDHKRSGEAVAAIHSGLALDRSHGPVLVAAASILTDAHREPALAERCLRDYLAGHSRSDAAPAFKVHLQLARLLAARGQSEEASRETATAQALAPAFHSARSAQGI